MDRGIIESEGEEAEVDDGVDRGFEPRAGLGIHLPVLACHFDPGALVLHHLDDWSPEGILDGPLVAELPFVADCFEGHAPEIPRQVHPVKPVPAVSLDGCGDDPRRPFGPAHLAGRGESREKSPGECEAACRPDRLHRTAPTRAGTKCSRVH